MGRGVGCPTPFLHQRTGETPPPASSHDGERKNSAVELIGTKMLHRKISFL